MAEDVCPGPAMATQHAMVQDPVRRGPPGLAPRRGVTSPQPPKTSFPCWPTAGTAPVSPETSRRRRLRHSPGTVCTRALDHAEA